MFGLIDTKSYVQFCLWNTLQMNFDGVNDVVLYTYIYVCIRLNGMHLNKSDVYQHLIPYTKRVDSLLTYIFVLGSTFSSSPNPAPLLQLLMFISLALAISPLILTYFVCKHFSVVEICGIYRHATMWMYRVRDRTLWHKTFHKNGFVWHLIRYL